MTFLRTVCGSIPCSALYSSCTFRRRLVSEIAWRIESVIWSAYMITWPSTLRAARPIVWISDVDERRNPSLSASRIATSDDLGQVEALPQQVDAHEHVEVAEAEGAQDLDPLQRVDLAVQVAHADAELEEVVGEVLGHLLRERGDEHPLVGVGPDADLGHEVVDLALGGLHEDLGIDEAGRAHDLLDDLRSTARSRTPLGVADRKTSWLTLSTNSSKRSGRLSIADGSRNP